MTLYYITTKKNKIVKEKITKVSQFTVGNETKEVLRDIERAIKERDRDALLLYKLTKAIYNANRKKPKGKK